MRRAASGLLSTRCMRITHPRIGHADNPGVAADHQEDKGEERHIPSVEHTHVVRCCQSRLLRLLRLLPFGSWETQFGRINRTF